MKPRSRGNDDPEDLLSVYLSSIRPARLSSPGEGARDDPGAAQGRLEAKRRLVVDHLGYVVKIAMRYVNRGVPLLDLIQTGNLVFTRAAEHYDPSLGVAFVVYARRFLGLKLLDLIKKETTWLAFKSLEDAPPGSLQAGPRVLRPSRHRRFCRDD